MTWDGVERRRNVRICPADCKLEDTVIQTSKDVVEVRGQILNLNTRINGSLEKMSMYMENGVWWRRTIIALSITLLTSVMSGLIIATRLGNSFGQNQRQIDINTRRLDLIEQAERHIK